MRVFMEKMLTFQSKRVRGTYSVAAHLLLFQSTERKETTMKKLEESKTSDLCSLSAAFSAAVTPNFTQGSMQSTTTTTIDIERTIEREIMGGDYKSWSEQM